MTQPHAAPDPDTPRQWLSDLTDGRLQGEALAAACRDWTADAEARRTWHAYHLIGDVLRSDDLAQPADGDAAFLAALRQRLAAEPVVLAPAAAVSRTRSRRQLWLMPMAAAAGFVAVAGVVVVLRQVSPAADGFAGPQLAAAPPATLAIRAVSTQPMPNLDGSQGMGQAALARGAMLRDARVDDYLRAHREALMGSPAALPGGGVRAVDFDTATPR